MMKEITIADVKLAWRVKIGNLYMEQNRTQEWLKFKRTCLEKRWDLEQAYDYLTKFRWYHH